MYILIKNCIECLKVWSSRWLFFKNHKDIGTLYLMLIILSIFLLNINIIYLDSLKNWQIGFQDRRLNFYNTIMFFITMIVFFVSWLLFICLHFFNKNSNFSQKQFTYSTILEIVLIIVLTIILMIIAICFFNFIYSLDKIPKPFDFLQVPSCELFEEKLKNKEQDFLFVGTCMGFCFALIAIAIRVFSLLPRP